MIKNTITMSEEAFFAMLELLGCAGKYQLPKYEENSNEAMQKFIRGRDELCLKGWAELDFDGGIYPTAWFSRMIYTIPRVESGMFFQNDTACQWFLRGPIEQLHIQKEDSSYTLTQCGTNELVTWLKKDLYATEQGVLTTRCKDKEEKTNLTQTTQSTKKRAEILARHMCIYFEKEADHA